LLFRPEVAVIFIVVLLAASGAIFSPV